MAGAAGRGREARWRERGEEGRSDDQRGEKGKCDEWKGRGKEMLESEREGREREIGYETGRKENNMTLFQIRIYRKVVFECDIIFIVH